MKLPGRSTTTLRVRIAVGFFVAALTVSGFVALATYALASAYLTRQRVDSIKRQSFNTLRFAAEHLAAPPPRTSLEELASLLRTRGDADVVVASQDRAVASSISVTAQTVPPALSRAVAAGRVGYAEAATPPGGLVFGSRVPQSDVAVYLVYPLQQLHATLRLLQRILVSVVAVAVLAGAGLGLRVARLMIDPLRRASEAAHRVAEGQLATRLDEAGDELGMFARSFNRMSTALQERIDLERRFVADASHEVRTPLTALRASVEYMAGRAGEIDDAFRATAHLAMRQVLALQRLVDDLLELSRMQAGALEVLDEYVDLGAFARELARRRGDGVHVECLEPAKPVVVQTDKRRLERVVGNLLENAVTHGDAKSVAVRVLVDDGRPVIEVHDAGPGIRASDLGRVFDRFWRGQQARRRGATGAGLGLAIARENAGVLGAEVDVRSPAEGGTVASVRMAASALVTSPAGDDRT